MTNSQAQCSGEYARALHELRPRLREHLQIHIHCYRNEPWYVIEDGLSGRYHRFNVQAYRVLRLLDGKRNVAEIHEQLVAGTSGDALSLREVIALLSNLHAIELLDSGSQPRTDALIARARRGVKLKWHQRAANPLTHKVPLFDPQPLLDSTRAIARVAFSAPCAWAFVIATVWAVVTAAGQWPELQHHFSTRALAPSNLALSWVLFPCMKLLHELGHAYALNRLGIRVREMGIMLLVFTPVPYVDASASIVVANKWQRALVAFAGIAVELALASAALAVWLVADSELARDIAFNVMFLAVGSSLLFNANPLLRFDGYYVLCDVIEIPNLARRAREHCIYLIQRYLFSLPGASSQARSTSEAMWLAAYGVLSGCYRTVVLLLIATFVASKLFLIGLILAVWIIVTQMLWPLFRMLRFLLREPQLANNRLRAITTSIAFIGAPIATVLLLPMSHSTYAQGIVRPGEGTQIRAATAGFVSRVVAEPGAWVRRGEPLVILEDASLQAETRRARARVVELEREIARADVRDVVASKIFRRQLEVARQEHAALEQDVHSLQVRSSATGVFDMVAKRDWRGRYVDRGQVLAWVRTADPATARVVVAHTQALDVRRDSKRIDVQLAVGSGDVVSATLRGEVPAGKLELPNALFGRAAGGEIAVDARQVEGTRALNHVFEFELALPGSGFRYRPGERVHAYFRHSRASLTQRWFERLKLSFARFLDHAV